MTNPEAFEAFEIHHTPEKVSGNTPNGTPATFAAKIALIGAIIGVHMGYRPSPEDINPISISEIK